MIWHIPEKDIVPDEHLHFLVFAWINGHDVAINDHDCTTSSSSDKITMSLQKKMECIRLLKLIEVSARHTLNMARSRISLSGKVDFGSSLVAANSSFQSREA